MKDIISFKGDWSFRDYSEKEINFDNLIDLYEIEFKFDEIEYSFTLPEDTLLDVKESDTQFNSKRLSKISVEDEVLIPFFSFHRNMAPIYTIGSITEREVKRRSRTILKEKHLVKVSSIARVKEKVSVSEPLEIVYKTLRHDPLHPLRPIIPINSIYEEWINND